MVKIFGLIEDNDFLILGMPVGKINQDHPDLWQVVEQTKQSKVGIELQTMPSIPIPPKVQFKIPEIYRTLEARLRQENQVFNIDDDALFEEFVKIFIGLSKGLSPMNQYKKITRADYIQCVERDKKMFAKLNAENPDIVFMGAAHAYYTYLQNSGHQVFVEAPINIEQVQLNAEMALLNSPDDEMLDAHLKCAPPLVYKLFKLDEEIDRFRSQMEKIENHALVCERRYSILKQKKVEQVKQKPDYVGSWTVDAARQDLPVVGFFELHIMEQDGDNLKGIIKDALGFAKFQGRFTSDSVDLEKTYFDASELAMGESIRYTGSGTNFCYSGLYKGRESNHGRPFLMVKYKPGIEKMIIETEDSKKLLEKVLQGKAINPS